MNYRGYRSFYSAIQAVHLGEADYAMIPVENSTAGRVMEVYNLLPESDLHIVGEYLLPINHRLMIPFKSFRGAPPRGTMTTEEIIAWKKEPLTDQEKSLAMTSIREVRSHPQALEQCRKFIKANLPNATIRSVNDTAISIRDIASSTDRSVAAIASRSAGEIYHSIILAEDIEDIKNNTTRFLILAKEPVDKNEIGDKSITTLLFETSHEPGSLYKMLRVFEENGVSLTKLETYMSGAARPNPAFYIDVGTNLLAPDKKQVLDALKDHTRNLQVLGVYNASDKRGDGSSFLPAQ